MAVVFATCPLCEAGCGLELTLADGGVTRIRGDGDDVFSHGFICPKGASIGELHDDPDRLRTPLLRVDGELRPATWDEAFAEIDRRLNAIWDAHGGQALLELVDGEAAVVRSRAGELVVPVEVTEDVMPGVVSIPHGWGHDLPGVSLSVAGEHPGTNSNVLADELLLEPLSGTAVLNGIPVELEPAHPRVRLTQRVGRT